MIQNLVELARLFASNLQTRLEERADRKREPIGPYEAFKRLGERAASQP